MAAIHETAYPRVKSNFSQKELKEIFTPTDEELFLLNVKTKRTLPVPRLGFMIILKYYQYLGRPIKTSNIDEYIKKFIADKINVSQDADLINYNKKTRKRHIKVIREYTHYTSRCEQR
jgi:hypothetical protein